MGNGIIKQDNSDRRLQDKCEFCSIVQGVGTRKIYEDELVVAFHDIRPAAKVHILVIPRQHIVSTHHLRHTTEDQKLLQAMLVAGQRLVSEIEPDAETKFGFHDPPFLSVDHLHLHCFALPHKSLLSSLKFVVSQRGNRGFVTVEQVLKRLEARGSQ